jgi:hypothetical protein
MHINGIIGTQSEANSSATLAAGRPGPDAAASGAAV